MMNCALEKGVGHEASGSGQTKQKLELRTRDVRRVHVSAMAWRSFRNSNEGDFMRQEIWLRGNTRTLKRQYAARNWTFTRVLPGIAGYCRVVGPGEKIDGWEVEIRTVPDDKGR
jgi:hypothetical protein